MKIRETTEQINWKRLSFLILKITRVNSFTLIRCQNNFSLPSQNCGEGQGGGGISPSRNWRPIKDGGGNNTPCHFMVMKWNRSVSFSWMGLVVHKLFLPLSFCITRNKAWTYFFPTKKCWPKIGLKHLQLRRCILSKTLLWPWLFQECFDSLQYRLSLSCCIHWFPRPG